MSWSLCSVTTISSVLNIVMSESSLTLTSPWKEGAAFGVIGVSQRE